MQKYHSIEPRLPGVSTNMPQVPPDLGSCETHWGDEVGKGGVRRLPGARCGTRNVIR